MAFLHVPRLALLLFAWTVSAVAAATEATSLLLLDDLGRTIMADLEVCFQIETRSECRPSREGTPVVIPPEADAVRVEGEDHKPVSVRRSEMAGKDGRSILKVPRKARLDVAAPAEEKIRISVYSQDDPAFRTPSFRGEARGSFVKIPAGRHLVSLAAGDKAPDLHLLTAEPGGRHRLAWTARPGWSLVLRFRSGEDDAPVEKAVVRLEGSEGFSAPGQGTLRGLSGPGGLALFSGVPHVLASAFTDHPVFVPSRVAGANLTSYRVESGERMTRLGSVFTDQEGRFEIPASGGGIPVRVFATGAGCPLAPFDLMVSEEEAVLQCPALPSSVELYFQDQQGRPVAGRSVVGRYNGKVIPNEVLITHLSRFRLPAASDGAGRLLLVGLAPGSYELYLADATNPELIAMGAPHGFLTSASLAPFTTTELQVTVETVPGR